MEPKLLAFRVKKSVGSPQRFIRTKMPLWMIRMAIRPTGLHTIIIGEIPATGLPAAKQTTTMTSILRVLETIYGFTYCPKPLIWALVPRGGGRDRLGLLRMAAHFTRRIIHLLMI